MDQDRFEWDAKKAETNRQKHGVSFQEASTVFDDPLLFVERDIDHGERRYLAIGKSGWNQHRVLFVVHIELDGDRIRIISA